MFIEVKIGTFLRKYNVFCIFLSKNLESCFFFFDLYAICANLVQSPVYIKDLCTQRNDTANHRYVLSYHLIILNKEEKV